MSVNTEIDRIKAAVDSAYNAIQAKGGTVPSDKTVSNLSSSISSISVSTFGVKHKNTTTGSYPSTTASLMSWTGIDIPAGSLIFFKITFTRSAGSVYIVNTVAKLTTATEIYHLSGVEPGANITSYYANITATITKSSVAVKLNGGGGLSSVSSWTCDVAVLN